eukprot:14547690-Alexandrium_andersonii.AAC.1
MAEPRRLAKGRKEHVDSTYLPAWTPNSTHSKLELPSLNCAGPGTASSLIPEAPEECALRRFSRGFRI